MNQDIQKKILSLLNLEKDWNYGSGEKITEEAILIALAISDELPHEIYNFIESFPLEDGGS